METKGSTNSKDLMMLFLKTKNEETPNSHLEEGHHVSFK